MAYAFKWHIEGRVLECTLSGGITLDDMIGIRRDYQRDFSQQAKPPAVHILFDIGKAEKPTFRFSEFFDVEKVEGKDAPIGWRLYYGSNEVLFRFAMTIFHESQGHQAHWFSSREAALEFLCAEDASLGC